MAQKTKKESKSSSYSGDIEKDKQFIHLCQKAECITFIVCENCKKEEKFNGDLFDCIEAIYDNGWRVLNEKCLCKKCQKL